MERVEKGNDIVIVPTLVFLEVIEVIRKRLTEGQKYVGLSQSVKQEIRKKVELEINKFVDKMTKLAKQGKVLLVDPEKSLKEYLQIALALFKPNFGDVTESSFCFVCNRDTQTRYKYRGIGHYDIQHAINAKELSANEIVSFDKGFSQLQNMAEFVSLRITIP